MFESAELGHTIDKERYEREEPELRHNLLGAQYELVEQAKFSTVIVISGVDGAGKGDTLNMINEWMDPRHIQTNAMRPVEDDLYGRPAIRQFWRVLPPKGRIGVFVGSWYSTPFIKRVYRETKASRFGQQIDQILRFERMLADEGTLILKYWLHLSKKGQRARFEKLSSKKKTAWRVTDSDWQHLDMYDRFQGVAQHMLRETSTADAPWTVVEGADARYRSLTIGTSILTALRGRLDEEKRPERPARAPARVKPLDDVSILDRLELDRDLEKEAYKDELAKLQGELNVLTRHKNFGKTSVVCVFEGVDAAGKGGAIRRVTQALDARKYDVIPIASPTEEERARPYLWRFWRQIPEHGRMVIFDRSWYGRVLVERVEKYCAEADWMRAYGEINDFEEQLAKSNAVVVKFWLQISKDEQLRRFKEREATPFKKHKITDDDWRNREKWDEYNTAICEMFDRTSTEVAPWHLIPANNKYYARIEVLRALVKSIDAAL